jgi:hypothetical protein
MLWICSKFVILLFYSCCTFALQCYTINFLIKILFIIFYDILLGIIQHTELMLYNAYYTQSSFSPNLRSNLQEVLIHTKTIL